MHYYYINYINDLLSILEFQSTYQWSEGDAVRINRTYHSICSKRFSQEVHRAKTYWQKNTSTSGPGKRIRNYWFHDEYLPYYVRHWESEEAKRRSAIARANKAKNLKPTWFGGSRSIDGVKEKLVCL